jgi:hypothetical protein
MGLSAARRVGNAAASPLSHIARTGAAPSVLPNLRLPADTGSSLFMAVVTLVQQMIKPKHVPIRTCVACRSTDAKRGLLRVVRQPDGTVLYDAKGKIAGRGAYVCAQADCIALARKQKKLERSLKVSGIPESLYAELTANANRSEDKASPATEADTNSDVELREDLRGARPQESEE